MNIHSLKGDTVSFPENNYVSYIFWLDTSACKQSQAIYRLEVQTKTKDGTYEYDGRVIQWNNTCIVTYEKSVRCLSKNGPAELYRKLNQTHVEIEWTVSWKEVDSGSLRTINLSMFGMLVLFF